jgi:hypothetical protein
VRLGLAGDDVVGVFWRHADHTIRPQANGPTLTTLDSRTYSLELYGGKELPFVHSAAGLPEGTVETVTGGKLELRADGTWTYVLRSETSYPSGATQRNEATDEGTFVSEGGTIVFTSAQSNGASFPGIVKDVFLETTHKSTPLTFVRATFGTIVKQP